MDHPAQSLDLFGILWRLGATLFFVVLNGFFVAAEFALVKVRESRLGELAAQGSPAARAARHMLGHLDRYLSACQLGITLASLILGALGEPAVSRLLLAGFSASGMAVDPEARWLPVVSIGLAFTIITVLHMTLGEQAPKMWAIRRAEQTTLRTALPLRAFTFAFGPFISMIHGLSNWMLRVAGLPQEEGYESPHTAEEIRSLLSLSARAGHISEREQELTENVFRMIELEVRHVLVPRVDVAYLSLEREHEQNLAIVRDAGHSRFPVCEVGLDTIVGFVHARDVLKKALGGEPIDLAALAREALFVPDTMSLSDLLVELQGRREHCAAVVDERGTTVGLVFREDALEEIVGPLGDEFDLELPGGWRSLPEGVVELRGAMPLPEVLDRLALELEHDESEDTIGGYLTARLGRLPRKGDRVPIGRFVATVTEMGSRRVRRVRIERSPERDTPAPESS